MLNIWMEFYVGCIWLDPSGVVVDYLLCVLAVLVDESSGWLCWWMSLRVCCAGRWVFGLAVLVDESSGWLCWSTSLRVCCAGRWVFKCLVQMKTVEAIDQMFVSWNFWNVLEFLWNLLQLQWMEILNWMLNARCWIILLQIPDRVKYKWSWIRNILEFASYNNNFSVHSLVCGKLKSHVPTYLRKLEWSFISEFFSN